MAVFPIVEEYIEKFVILNEIGQWESFRTEERIVRCKDCVYYDETPIYTEASSELSTANCHMFSHFDIPYPVEPNGFCYLGTPKGVM